MSMLCDLVGRFALYLVRAVSARKDLAGLVGNAIERVRITLLVGIGIVKSSL
jgi:hypothetical protein